MRFYVSLKALLKSYFIPLQGLPGNALPLSYYTPSNSTNWMHSKHSKSKVHNKQSALEITLIYFLGDFVLISWPILSDKMLKWHQQCTSNKTQTLILILFIVYFLHCYFLPHTGQHFVAYPRTLWAQKSAYRWKQRLTSLRLTPLGKLCSTCNFYGHQRHLKIEARSWEWIQAYWVRNISLEIW